MVDAYSLCCPACRMLFYFEVASFEKFRETNKTPRPCPFCREPVDPADARLEQVRVRNVRSKRADAG